MITGTCVRPYSQITIAHKQLRWELTAKAIGHNTHIRPTMGYAVQAWSLWLQQDINLLLKIYHCATRLVFGLQNKPHDRKIANMNLLASRVNAK